MAGGQFAIEVHYTPNGKDTMDQTQLGLLLAKTPPRRRFVLMAPEHLVDPRKPIPGRRCKLGNQRRTHVQPGRRIGLVHAAHAPARQGYDFPICSTRMAGTETVLNANFNFNWQLGYELEDPILVTKGTQDDRDRTP